MREFVAIGVEAALIEEEDAAAAIALAQEGRTVPVPRIERALLLLERGVGYDVQEGEERDSGERRSAEGRAVAFANHVNALALSMTWLPQCGSRDVFLIDVLCCATVHNHFLNFRVLFRVSRRMLPVYSKVLPLQYYYRRLHLTLVRAEH
ncbi:hypothetical protein EDB85DRAFT_793007 [Lactarius pseudohatsudake]|nr:hypothetical protein EDB85DRAFT_793007 [Lactarius pseudohatsudake]